MSKREEERRHTGLTASAIENSVWSPFHSNQMEVADDMRLTALQAYDKVVVQNSTIVNFDCGSLRVTWVQDKDDRCQSYPSFWKLSYSIFLHISTFRYILFNTQSFPRNFQHTFRDLLIAISSICSKFFTTGKNAMLLQIRFTT